MKSEGRRLGSHLGAIIKAGVLGTRQLLGWRFFMVIEKLVTVNPRQLKQITYHKIPGLVLLTFQVNGGERHV